LVHYMTFCRVVNTLDEALFQNIKQSTHKLIQYNTIKVKTNLYRAQWSTVNRI